MMAKRAWKMWGLVAVPVVVLAVIVAEPASVAWRVYSQRALPSVPLPDRLPPADRVEAQRQDLDDLARLMRIDRSFSDHAQTMFSIGLAALRDRAGMMSDADFAMEVSRLVALAGNGHTAVDPVWRADQFGRVKLRLAWFADGLYVARAADAALVGARVVAIEGHSARDALKEVQPFLSGTIERTRAISPPLLESPALMQTVWPTTDGAHLTYALQLPSGEMVNRVLMAEPPSHDNFTTQPILAIFPGIGGAAWKSLWPEGAALPLSLRDPHRILFSAPLEGGRIYIRLNAVADDISSRLADQLAALLATALPEGWRLVVLDLRFNEGGNQTKIDAFTRNLPKALAKDGTLDVLIGNASFSAAIITLARAKHSTGARTHIVGEPVGDKGRFWAEGGTPLVLRNSGIVIRAAAFLHDWTDGCRSIRNCYPVNFIDGVGAGDLSPEHIVGWKFSDYAAGRDTVLDAALADHP